MPVDDTKHNMQDTRPTPSADVPNSKWDDSEFHQPSQLSWWAAHRRESIISLVLLCALALVVFGLPRTVELTTPESSARSLPLEGSSAPPIIGQQQPSGTTELSESPWQDAQLSKARRAAQEVLAKLLDKQKQLETLQVQLWGADAFSQAMNLASEGDQLYRQRQFSLAQTNYNQTLLKFEALIRQAEELFERSLNDGFNALDQQDLQKALDTFALATTMRPHNEKAQQGFKRASTLEQVIIHLENANNLEQQLQLDQAKQAIEQALDMDAESKAAQAQLTHIKAAINNRDYARRMGQGFDHLYQQQLQSAIDSFQQALALKPTDNAAQQALIQAKNQQTQTNIKQLLQSASEAETQESWSKANQRYQSALALDKSLIKARVGEIRSQARLTLEQTLRQTSASPLRLADPQALSHAKQLLNDALAVKPQGQKLVLQTQLLQETLSKAQQPISIVLRSDNSTQVTLYKVGALGNFSEHQIELTPGHYTAVGHRAGYRDVREEFTVKPSTANLTIVIQCLDKISREG